MRLNTSDRLTRWAEAVAHFNRAKIVLMFGVGGVIGFALSLAASTVAVWGLFSVVTVLIVAAVGVMTGKRPSPATWVCVAIAPFFNQVAFLSWNVYFIVLAIAVSGLLAPALLRVAAHALRLLDSRPDAGTSAT